MIDPICFNIIKELKINCFVETGMDKGETIAQVGRWFSQIDSGFGVITDTFTTEARPYTRPQERIVYPIFSNVKSNAYEIHSVDTEKISYETAKNNFRSNSNIHLYHSDSVDFLKKLLGQGEAFKKNGMFFLDAHWGDYWPLRDEITVIRQLKKYIIVIDDFLVPGKSDPAQPYGAFGFDLYKGQVLSWAYIHDLFAGSHVRIFYPTKPNADQRGWVVITHGFSEDELKALGSLDLFEVKAEDPRHTSPVLTTWRAYRGKMLIKKFVPISILRFFYRIYEKALHYSTTLFQLK